MNPDTRSIEEALLADRAAIERRCAELLDTLAAHHAGMLEAIRYSVLGGGKRLRPLLCVWTHDLFAGHAREAALDVGCAVEFIHSYSLVHDDLPCMDDDDLRRGKPSTHKQFGEAIAVLAGDALLNLAYETLGTLRQRHPKVSADTVAETLTVLAGAAGTGGLISGQAQDLEGGSPSVERVTRIHDLKTGRLISAAMELGAAMAGIHMDARAAVRESGLLAGRAFQMIDDVLDTEADKETLGKTPGKDLENNKLTYPSLVGNTATRREARALLAQSLALLPAGTGEVALGRLLARLVDRQS